MSKKNLDSKKTDITAQFLIAEFNALQERAKNFEDIKANRVNFFLLVVAAAGAILSAANHINLLKQYYLESIILTAFILLLLGLSTLKDTMDYSGAIVVLFRRAGRVRRWFVDFDDKIASYIAFEPADDRPRIRVPYSLLSWRGAESIVILFNAISSAAIIICFVIKFFDVTQLLASSIIAIVTIAAWFLQKLYVYRKMAKAQDSDSGPQRINFPYSEYSGKIARQENKE